MTWWGASEGVEKLIMEEAIGLLEVCEEEEIED